MFTVPLYPFIHTRARVRVVDGKVENILEPIYHKNPISKEGSLVTYDWGADIIDIIEKTTGMKTEIFDIKNSEESMYMGLEADFLQVLVSYKM